MHFRIRGLSPEPYRHLYGQSDADLAELGVIRYHVDRSSGFPDRIEMRDAEPGETVLLLNHVSQTANTPYHATHAIFIREGAVLAYDRVDEVPDMMRRRLLSLRGFDARGMMIDADVCEGAVAPALISRLFQDASIVTIHAHNARQGCYSGRIDRV